MLCFCPLPDTRLNTSGAICFNSRAGAQRGALCKPAVQGSARGALARGARWREGCVARDAVVAAAVGAQAQRSASQSARGKALRTGAPLQGLRLQPVQGRCPAHTAEQVESRRAGVQNHFECQGESQGPPSPLRVEKAVRSLWRGRWRTRWGGKQKTRSIWLMTDEEHQRFHAGFRDFCVRCDVQKNPTLYSSLASAVIPPRHAPSTMREVSSWEAKQDPVLKS